jgi:hypothetical protein
MPKCVECGQPYHPDSDEYVDLGGDAVCRDGKCKWTHIRDQFVQYIKGNNVLERIDQIRANPTLDAIIALRRDLVDASADETGKEADIDPVDAVLGPLFDAQDLLRRNEFTELVPESLDEAREAVEAILNNTPQFTNKDKKFLKDIDSAF